MNDSITRLKKLINDNVVLSEIVINDIRNLIAVVEELQGIEEPSLELDFNMDMIKVGQEWELRSGYVATITEVCEEDRAIKGICMGEPYSWLSHGRFFEGGSSNLDLYKLVRE